MMNGKKIKKRTSDLLLLLLYVLSTPFIAIYLYVMLSFFTPLFSSNFYPLTILAVTGTAASVTAFITWTYPIATLLIDIIKKVKKKWTEKTLGIRMERGIKGASKE